jgi:hypothetical protein
MTRTATISTSVEIGGSTVTIERVSTRKASTALALMRHLSSAMPGLQTELAEFRRTYERENVLELDRVQARIRNPARPMLDEHGQIIVTKRDIAEDGTVLVEGGAPVMLPSPVDRMTEADWAQTGGVYRVPATPATYEIVAALFSSALEVAEEHVYKLLALFTVPNEEVTRRRKDGSLMEHLKEVADDLVDNSLADEILELAVVCGEILDTQLKSKLTQLGDRVGKVLTLIGISTKPQTDAATSTDGSSSSKPSSSTASPTNTTDGTPTSSSNNPTNFSSSSDTSSSSIAIETSSSMPVGAT